MANPTTLAQFSRALADLVAGTAPSIVAVHSQRSRSSGFVWRPGLIVTADEALADDGEVSVVGPDGKNATAAIIGRDPTTDIALLRAETAGAPLAFDATPPQAGSLALAVGARDGRPSAAYGIVSFLGEAWRSLRGGDIDARIELDLGLRRAGEGGAALSADGRAFGMAVFGPRRRVIVIPAGTIERVAARLLSHGRIPRGYLGLGLQPVRVDAAAGGTGVMVMSVADGSPGASAGLRQGDVITAWDDRPVAGVRSLLGELGPDSVGREVSLTIRRGGEPLSVRLTIGERPAA